MTSISSDTSLLSFLFFFFSLAALHAASPAITPVAARLHDNWPEPSSLSGSAPRLVAGLASHITRFASPSEHTRVKIYTRNGRMLPDTKEMSYLILNLHTNMCAFCL